MDAGGLSLCSPHTDCDVDSYFKNQSGEQISDPRQYLFVITGSPILGGQERWEPRVSVKEEIVGMSA